MSLSTACYCFFVYANRLLPNGTELYWPKPKPPAGSHRVGDIQGLPCYVVEIEEPSLQQQAALVSLRDVIEQVEQGLFLLAGRALQLVYFYRTHAYCGQCGAALDPETGEHMVYCAACDLRYYPRISPCVIVAVRKRDQMLLVQTHRHRGRLHSIIAGFVEPGETLEQAAAREVAEETGININRVRYVASQPWPFPHSLMAGFIADWESGEISIQQEEIHSADWFDVDQLPILAPPGTIARTLIDMVKTEIEGG